MTNSAFVQSQSPYASETAAGLVEEATTAQIESRASVGETGAPLFVPPSKMPEGDSVNLFTADEAITAGQAVALKLPTLTAVVAQSNTAESTTAGFNLVNNDAWYARKYTASAFAFQLKKITLKIQMGITSGTLEVRIRQGSPTGSTLYTYTTHNYAASETSVDVKDLINLSITPGGVYYICVLQTVTPGGTEANRRRLLGAAVTPSDNTMESSNAGGSFTNNGFDMYLIVEENQYTALEKVVKASAASLAEAINFVGFAKNSAAIGETVNIDFSTVVSPSGASLSAAATYYLSNTPGAISTAPGTIRRVIGKAVTTTKIVRKRGPVSNPIASASSTASPVDGMYQGHNAGGQHQMSSDGITYTVLNGMAVMVPRGAAYSISAGSGYLVIIDYGSII